MSLRTASFALLAGLVLAAPAAAFAAPSIPAAEIVETTKAPARAAAPDAASYADREAKNKQVANYEGGQTVVIAMSGGALVVLLILLLLL